MIEAKNEVRNSPACLRHEVEWLELCIAISEISCQLFTLQTPVLATLNNVSYNTYGLQN